MTIPPDESESPPVERRRYWGYYNRPYAGCGCLYLLITVILLWWLLAYLVPALAFWETGAMILPFVG